MIVSLTYHVPLKYFLLALISFYCFFYVLSDFQLSLQLLKFYSIPEFVQE